MRWKRERLTMSKDSGRGVNDIFFLFGLVLHSTMSSISAFVPLESNPSILKQLFYCCASNLFSCSKLSCSLLSPRPQKFIYA